MIPFNRPHVTGDELRFIAQAVERMQLSANGEFTRYWRQFLKEWSGAECVLLTHSCTAALEAAVLRTGLEHLTGGAPQ